MNLHRYAANLHKFQHSTYIVETTDGHAFQIAGYRADVMYQLMDEFGYDFYTLSIYEV